MSDAELRTTSGPTTGTAAPPRGYALVLPPGWARIPLRSGGERAISAILDRTFDGMPRDQVATARHQLRTRLTDMAAAARDTGGLDLYLPTERMHGFTVAASFVVAEVSFGSVELLDPSLLVARLASAGDAQPAEVDGTIGTRTESLASPDPPAGVEFGSRRVDYVLPVPEDQDRWLVVTFSTVGQGDPADDLAELLVELFDAVLSTFRWRNP